MALSIKKSTTFTGQINVSKKTQEGAQEVMVMYLSATIAEDGTANINKSIQNPEVYTTNKKEIDTDSAAFEAEVLANI